MLGLHHVFVMDAHVGRIQDPFRYPYNHKQFTECQHSDIIKYYDVSELTKIMYLTLSYGCLPCQYFERKWRALKPNNPVWTRSILGLCITKKSPCENKSMLTDIFKPSFCLAGGTAARQTEAMFENLYGDSIIWTNAGLLRIGTNSSEIWITHNNMCPRNWILNAVCQMATILSRPQCNGN